MKGIPVNEQETTIQFDRDGDMARIWTSDTTVMTKLDKLVKTSDLWECTDAVTETDSLRVVAKEYRCPKRLVSFRSGKTSAKSDLENSNSSEDN